VANLTVQPAPAKSGQPPTFYITFLNPTGAGQGSNVCVEIWDPNKPKNSIGITTCRGTTIAPGTSQVPATDWKVSGLGGCVGYRARVVAKSGEDRTPFTQPDGADFWLDFQVCP
jgi:hypothetical protein